MHLSLPVSIGLRYLRARRRNRFISFISFSSLLGVTLGIMALIVILSVMNGFEKELRGRILGMTAHVWVRPPAEGEVLSDWRNLQDRLRMQPRVQAITPEVQGEAMIVHAGYINGVQLRGILPEQSQATFIADKMVEGKLQDLAPGRFGIILGEGLARALRANVGDKVTVISPQPVATPAGILPRSRRFTVVGVFEVGTQEYDTAMAVAHMQDTARLFRLPEGVSGLRLKLDDAFAAPAVAAALNAVADGRYRAVPWTEEHVSFFNALKTEKVMMFIILSLIVAVAAFNIVATLVMVVIDKQADIAILRTLGLRTRQVMQIFIAQGAVIGAFGMLLGGAAGVVLAWNLPAVMRTLEQSLHFKVFDPTVYYISDIPSDLRWPDVGVVLTVGGLLCFLATLYPAWRAARTQPAEALRYE
ncbi:MAG TPA: lipoprotein-releasing ABC transporter permease subunit [Gammaproteobacteria bacterium]|nr:lipoprotein-releasing ABC transporter permease subunit [Gammaproteobacteria bacterium]